MCLYIYMSFGVFKRGYVEGEYYYLLIITNAQTHVRLFSGCYISVCQRGWMDLVEIKTTILLRVYCVPALCPCSLDHTVN